jgi:thiol-disulfide isomerase/thioredoxin/YHS domain-containing protein
MRYIDRIAWLGLGLVLASFFLPNAFAQQSPVPWQSNVENASPFPWQSNLDTARRVAAQSNRLVLIHFWAAWCGACNRMEAEVFNQPGLAAAITPNYVPVKINADQTPSIAKQYGITALPTDVVITPQGQVVDSIRGRSEATQYVVRLNQIAAARQQSTGQMAQIPANIPARAPERPTAEEISASNLSLPKNKLSDDRYADYFRRNSADVREQPSLGAQDAAEPIKAAPAPVSPPYGNQQPVADPEIPSAGSDQLSAASASSVQNIAPPPTPGATPPSMAGLGQQALPYLSQQTTPPANQLSQSPALNTSEQTTAILNQAFAGKPALSGNPASGGNPVLAPPAANTAQQISSTPPSPPLPSSVASTPQQSGAGTNVASPVAPGAARQPAASTLSTPPAPPANPPLCLDGYCPVSLAEKQQWVPGDRRFGAIHRGRTYLFAGADQQRRFFTDPDRYAPMISGNDIVQVIEKGQFVPGKREHGVFFNNHIFLFADEAALEKFSKDPAHYASQALEAVQASNHTAQQLR